MLPARIATHVMMMITMKNNIMKITTGAMTIVNTIIMIGQRDKGLHSHITTDRKTQCCL